MPWLTLNYSQFTYLVVNVLLRRLDDAPLLLRETRPQLRILRWLRRGRWLQVRASGYHRHRTPSRTSPWRIKRFKRWRIFSDLVEGERVVERRPGKSDGGKEVPRVQGGETPRGK
jgi:hypothetical protein